MEIRDLKEKIESLQAQLVSLREAQVTHYCANCEDMAARLEVVQRRERAAVEDLTECMTEYACTCKFCKKWNGVDVCRPSCKPEWRGPQAGRGGNDEQPDC